MSQELLVPRALRRRRASNSWLYLPGVAGNYASAPDSAELSVTGDIDLRCRVALDDWTPAGVQTLVAKRTASGNKCSYRLHVNTSGDLVLNVSPDGTTGAEVAVVSSTNVPVADGEVVWVRVTLDVDDESGNRVGTFYTSTDGSAWTALGSADTEVGTTSLNDNDAVLELGSINAGTGNLLAGKLYNVQIYDGIDGTLAFDADFTTALLGAGTFTEGANGATVTINTSGGDPAEIVGAWR